MNPVVVWIFVAQFFLINLALSWVGHMISKERRGQ